MRRAPILDCSWLLLAALTGACGASGASGPADASDAHPGFDGPAPRDAGGPDHAPGHADARSESGSMKDASRLVEASAADAAVAPSPVGTALAQGVISVAGVTDDGYVVYQRGNAVKAAPVAGGASVTLLDATDAAGANGIVVNVVRDDVFVWSDVNRSNGTATLGVWSSALAAAMTVSTTSVPSLYAASADSSVIAFSDGTSADGISTSLVAAQIGSLASHHVIATGIDPGNEDVPTCPPALAFSGTGAALFAVVGACTPIVLDGGTNGPFVVTAFPAPSWSGAVLATGASSFALDDSGTSAVILLASGAIESAPLAGGAPTLIDQSPDAGDVPSGQLYLSPSDTFVLWSTRAGALLTSSLESPSVTMLAAAGALDLDGVSASGSFALVDQGADMLTGFPEGLALVSTSTPGALATLSAGDVFLDVGGDAFTADGQYALYVTGVTPDGNGNPIGALTAVPVGTPGVPMTVAPNAGSFIDPITGVPSRAARALTGSRLAFVDAFDSSLGQAGQANLEVVDLATAAAAKLVMTAADPTFFVSPDRQHLLYTITFGGPTDGLYSVALP